MKPASGYKDTVQTLSYNAPVEKTMEKRASLEKTTQCGKPAARISLASRGEGSLSSEQEAALERLVSQSHHLGGRAPLRDELYEPSDD